MRWSALRPLRAWPSGMPSRLSLAAAGLLLLALVLAAADREAWRLALPLVVAPVLEETVFRAGLQEALLRHWHRRPGLANALTAITFGLAHALTRADAYAFAVVLPALLIGAAYLRTGKLRHCIALHAGMNAFWLFWGTASAALFGP